MAKTKASAPSPKPSRTRAKKPVAEPAAPAETAADQEASDLAKAQKARARPRRPPPPPPDYILWEVSRDCPLGCGTCRHSSLPVGTSKGLTTDEAVRFIDAIAHSFQSNLVLSGPEPLVRPDLFELADYARTRGIAVILATNATQFDFPTAKKAVEAKVRQMEIYLDGSSGRSHDGFRSCPAAFTQTVKGLELAKLAGIRYRISSAVTKQNFRDLSKIMGLAQKLGAAGYNIFLNVPIGRGVMFPDDTLSDPEYMEMLAWVFEQETKYPGYVRLYCSPQYERIYRSRAQELPDSMNPFRPGSEHRYVDHGCPAARRFLFVAHDGWAYPCPYLLQPAGHVLEKPLKEIWETAPVLEALREIDRTGGKCHRCKYLNDCRGCRALAMRDHKDPMAEDPACLYVPGE